MCFCFLQCEYLKNVGITHIVCIRQDIESHLIKTHFVDKFRYFPIVPFKISEYCIFQIVYRYLVINIADTVTENIIQHFQKVKVFLDECFAFGGKALVHGNAGISRSAAVVLGFVMEKYKLSYE